MAKLRDTNGNGQKRRIHSYDFTVVLTPVSEPVEKVRTKARRQVKGLSGYQVTVPLLPGVITYGRNEREALAMARDAIICHLEGLQKSGEPIPNERYSHTEKLRIAITA